MNYIITDIDDAVLAWRQPFEAWVQSEGKFQTRGNFDDFYTIEDWLGSSRTVARKLIEEFNSNVEYWPNFQPCHKSEIYLNKLNKEGYKFIAITACSNSEWSFRNRWNNLQKHFGDAFDTLHCTELGGSKRSFLERYRPTYWVEDKGSNAELGAELGHASFLIDFSHNKDIVNDNVCRVQDWEEIYNVIHADLSRDYI